VVDAMWRCRIMAGNNYVAYASAFNSFFGYFNSM
jgi:hypothetical protein